MEFIREMKIGESTHTDFGGEYRIIEEEGTKFVELFGPDDSYSKHKITPTAGEVATNFDNAVLRQM